VGSPTTPNPPGEGRPPWIPGPPPWHAPQPNPDSNPSPTRWFLASYGDSWVDTTLHVVVLTDIGCHLYMRWSDTEPVYHSHPKIKRGRSVNFDGKYCFVEYNDLEQNEPEDTLWHTFDLPGWEVCKRRWWHFWGTVSEEATPSNTPIYSAHYPDKTEAPSMRHTDLTERQVDGVIDHADESVTPAKLATPFTFSEFPFTPAEAPGQDYHVANKKYVDDQAAGAPFWEVIESKHLAAPAAYLEWTGIDPKYHTLRIVGHVGPSVNADRILRCRFNGDTAYSYAYNFFLVFAGSIAYSQASSATSLIAGYLLRDVLAPLDFLIQNEETSQQKLTASSPQGIYERMVYGSGKWNNTADRITTIRLYPSDDSLRAGSRLHLLGISV